MISRIFLLSLLAAACAVAGCDAPSDADPTLFGPTVSVGEGTARTYVTVDSAGTPTAAGVVLTAAALDGLPDHGAGHAMDDMHMLALPDGVEATGLTVDHVSLDWNPHGHSPSALFGKPHFDVHFYSVSAEERATWTPADPSYARATRLPAAQYVPARYVPDPSGEAVPMMGLHWLDSADPTYGPNGPGFQEVVLFGSYDGRMVFAEPMITTAFLRDLAAHGGHHEERLAQPQAVAVGGLYPTTYAVRYDAGRKEYRIELGGLVRRSAA